jgi:hypothetical protein
MKRVRRNLLGGAAALALGLGISAEAFAQAAPTLTGPVPGAQGQPGVRPERPDSQSPAARAAENYDPKGVQIGSFKLFPSLELDEIYNDNIYAVPTAQGKTGSFIQQIKPVLDLRSDWNVHMLNAYAKAGFGLYGIDSAFNNFQDVSVGADGRVDIQRNWNVYGGGSWNRRHEERGSPNSVSTAGIPVTVYNQTIGNVGYYQKFNRFSARADGRLDNYIYFNNGLGPAEGVIPNSDRNRNEFREALRLGYEFLPGYEVWVRGSLNQRTYFQNDSAGLNRSSTGFDIVGGILIDLGGITAIEVFAGYLSQTYQSWQFSNVSVPTFGLTGYWNPIRELWVKPFVRRTVDESALTTSAAYINTSGGLDIDYHMRPNIRLNAHGDYSVADYLPQAGVVGTRYDQYWTFRANAQYLFTENFYVGPSYQFISRNSNQANSSYDQNVIMLRLGARM